MAELFDLGRERAGPAFPEAMVEHASDAAGDGKHETPPFDSRVPSRIFGVEQIAVLDEQEALDDQRRDRRKIGIGPFGMAGLIEQVLLAIKQLQPRAGFLAVERVAALVDKACERGRPFGLALDREAVRAQRSNEGRQARITKPLVIRTPFRENDRLARPRFNRKAHLPGEMRKDPRLQIRGACLAGEAPADKRQYGNCDRPAKARDDDENRAGGARLAPFAPPAVSQTAPNRRYHHRAPRLQPSRNKRQTFLKRSLSRAGACKSWVRFD